MSENTNDNVMVNVFDIMSKTATKMCNPDKYRFLVEYLGEDVIVNCYGLCCFEVMDLNGYAHDLATDVVGALNIFDPCDEGYEWHLHSEPNYYDKDGNSCDDDGPVDCAQYQIYKIADGQ